MSLSRAAFVALVTASLTLVASRTALSEGEYTITLESPSSLAVGAEGSISLTIAPAAGQRISSEGPVRVAVAVTPGKGLKLDRRRLRRKHATDPKASSLAFSVRMVAEAAGSYELTVDIRFWVCGRRTCRPVRERRQVAVTAEGPAGDAGPPAGAADAGP